MNVRILALCTWIVIVCGVILYAQDPPRYRDYQLGSDLPSIAKQAGVDPAVATLVHQRPALIQELRWRPAYFLSGSSTRQTDPVAQIAFRFFNGELFRIVVDYDTERTEGLTDADLIEALSSTYGPAAKPAARAPRIASMEAGGDPDTLLARWLHAESSVSLIKVTYPVSYRLIVASTKLEGLARTAAAEAARLDKLEAPQRERASQKKADDDVRATQEKARLANKAAFKP